MMVPVVAFGALIFLAMLGAAIYGSGKMPERDEPDWETASRQEIEAWAAERQSRWLHSQQMMNRYMTSRDAAYDDKTFDLTKETTDDRR